MKDAFYFPHYSNLRNERKIRRVRRDLGIEGYGIYLMLIEVLRDQDGYKYPLKDIDLLADDFNTSFSKIEVVIINYDLFNIDLDNQFFSIDLNESMKPLQKMREQRKLAAAKSVEARKKLQVKTNEEPKINESAIKWTNYKAPEDINAERVSKFPKGNNDQQLIDFFISAGSDAKTASAFYDHYNGQGWVKSNGVPVTHWQSVARDWINRGLFIKPASQKSKDIGQVMRGYL